MRLGFVTFICIASSAWPAQTPPPGASQNLKAASGEVVPTKVRAQGFSDWNPRLAADYLDAREEAWYKWQIAGINGGPCISCHTPVPYLLARPALRRILGEPQPTR